MIHGKAQHGKDSLGDALNDHFDHGKIAYIALADPIKYFLVKYYGWDGVTKNEYWRDLLIKVGTEIAREQLDEDIWVRHAAETCDILFHLGFDTIVITDLRMRNELGLYEYSTILDAEDVTYVKVVRPDFETHLTAKQQSSITEQGLEDYWFNNVFHIREIPDKTTRKEFFDSLAGVVKETCIRCHENKYSENGWRTYYDR